MKAQIVLQNYSESTVELDELISAVEVLINVGFFIIISVILFLLGIILIFIDIMKIRIISC